MGLLIVFIIDFHQVFFYHWKVRRSGIFTQVLVLVPSFFIDILKIYIFFYWVSLSHQIKICSKSTIVKTMKIILASFMFTSEKWY